MLCFGTVVIFCGALGWRGCAAWPWSLGILLSLVSGTAGDTGSSHLAGRGIVSADCQLQLNLFARRHFCFLLQNISDMG